MEQDLREDWLEALNATLDPTEVKQLIEYMQPQSPPPPYHQEQGRSGSPLEERVEDVTIDKISIYLSTKEDAPLCANVQPMQDQEQEQPVQQDPGHQHHPMVDQDQGYQVYQDHEDQVQPYEETVKDVPMQESGTVDVVMMAAEAETTEADVDVIRSLCEKRHPTRDFVQLLGPAYKPRKGEPPKFDEYYSHQELLKRKKAAKEIANENERKRKISDLDNKFSRIKQVLAQVVVHFNTKTHRYIQNQTDVTAETKVEQYAVAYDNITGKYREYTGQEETENEQRVTSSHHPQPSQHH